MVESVSLILRDEQPRDRAAVRRVNRLAFCREEEARLVDRLRDEGHAELSLVAVGEGQVLGHILFSRLPIETDAGTIPALALAPLTVLPRYQRQGIGSQLVRRGLEDCRSRGHRIVIVLGDPEYYRRFGFSAKLARPLESPFAGDAFMAVELVCGALAGVSGRVVYPPPFFSARN